MQRAARKVVQENSRLRNLLKHHGISYDEIDTYLRSFDEDKASNEASLALATTLVSPQRGMFEVISGHGLGVSEPSCQNRSSGNDTCNNIPDRRYLIEHERGDLFTTLRRPITSESFSDARIQTETPSPRVIENQYYAQENNKVVDSECPNTHDCFCPPTTKSRTRLSTSGLEISCETAATIIIEMRGDGDVESVRKSLGCAGREECNVRNSTVLQILDEG
jgi:hypothetical protein